MESSKIKTLLTIKEPSFEKSGKKRKTVEKLNQKKEKGVSISHVPFTASASILADTNKYIYVGEPNPNAEIKEVMDQKDTLKETKGSPTKGDKQNQFLMVI